MDSVKKFLNSGAGKELRDYLLVRLEELKNIENLKEIDTPTHQAIELKRQRRAYLKLKEILSGVMTMGEKVSKKDPRDSFEI